MQIWSAGQANKWGTFFTPGEEELILMHITQEELLNNISGASRANAFPYGNQDSITFRWGAVQDRCYFYRRLPDEWVGADLLVLMNFHHKTGGLTGGGSPPDDQIRIECGWGFHADGAAIPDIGTINDGTAPNESFVNFQLGIIQDAPAQVDLSGGGINSGTDQWLWYRITRDAQDGTNDGLSGNIYSASGVDIVPA